MVQTISRDTFEAQLGEALERAGTTRDEFIEDGREGRLDSEELRTLWLIAAAVLR